jgi:hypothetical protein
VAKSVRLGYASKTVGFGQIGTYWWLRAREAAASSVITSEMAIVIRCQKYEAEQCYVFDGTKIYVITQRKQSLPAYILFYILFRHVPRWRNRWHQTRAIARMETNKDTGDGDGDEKKRKAVEEACSNRAR